MKHNMLSGAGLSYAPCRYGLSRIYFRGPRKPLDGRYIAFVGSNATYGKFVDKPFPALVEEVVGEVCVNFGCMNASIDAFNHDQTLLAACHDAQLTVLQVMGAQNMSNRFYTVHPRRNDRFLRASTVLQALYPEVDFSQFSFTRHMLGALLRLSPDRFAIVRSELQEAWVARTRSFLTLTGSPVMLLWFSDQAPAEDVDPVAEDHLDADPLFVTREMLAQLRPSVLDILEVQPSKAARAHGTEGMVFGAFEEEQAAGMMGVLAHAEASRALIRPIRTALASL